MRQIWKSALAAVSLSLTPQLALAQGAEFCAQSMDDLLTGLEGSWTIHQGPGYAIGTNAMGAAGTKVMPPGRVSLTFEYSPEMNVGLLTGQGQSMVMFPAGAEYVSAPVGSPNDPGAVPESAQGSACDWNALPVIIGTNAYSLSGVQGGNVPRGKVINLATVKDAEILVCERFFNDHFSGLPLPIQGVIRDGEPGPAGPAMVLCPEPDTYSGKGDMKMTLMLKFYAPNAGAGHLLFSGSMNKSKFSAYAPVTVSR